MFLLSGILAVLALLAAIALVWPLLAKDTARFEASDVSRNSVNSVVYQDRLKELEREVTNGTLVAEEFEQLKAELTKGLLGDVPEDKEVVAERKQHPLLRIIGAACVFLLVPAVSIGVYIGNGKPSEVQEWLALRGDMESVFSALQAGKKPDGAAKDHSVGDFVTALQRKAQENPNDAALWHMLGMGYMQMKAGEQAEQALRRAYRVEPDNVVYRFALAKLLIGLKQGQLEAESERLLLGVLEQDADNPQALAMLGMGYFFSEEYAPSLRYWRRLHALSLAQGAPQEKIDIIEKSIAAAQKHLTEAGSTTSAQEEQSAIPVAVTVTVNISAEMLASVSSTATLFIYAQHASGPQMPLAVVKQPAESFPVTVTLTDAQAMTPQFTLSGAQNVLIKARVSETHNAIPASGDLQGQSAVIDIEEVKKTGSTDLHVVIDHRIP